jgi:primosomal protein N' (replication factor Y)
MLVCKVAIRRVPVLLDYLAPDGLTDDSFPFGTPVTVPYRQSTVTGIVVATSDTLAIPIKKAKKINAIENSGGLIAHLKVFYERFCAYYIVHLSDLLDIAVPQFVWTEISQSDAGYFLVNQEKIVSRSHLTQAGWKLYDWLSYQGIAQSQGSMRNAGFRQSTIDQVIKKDMVVSAAQASPNPKKMTLSGEQQGVFEKIVEQNNQSAHYVCGVTGSGKTYLYIALALHWAQQQGQVLLLVPEIALTIQMMQKIQTFFPRDEIGCLHSGLTARERQIAWHRAATGKTRLLLGTRSAIFTPLPHLKAIIMDEEHDQSYKQMSQIRYSTRGVAFQRAQAQDAILVLGSATPSLACIRLIRDDRIMLHELKSRFNHGNSPHVNIINTKAEQLTVGFSTSALDLLDQTLQSGHRALIFLNRRGYSPALWCQVCDLNYICEGCKRPMVYHQAEQKLRCHRCQVVSNVVTSCQKCGRDSLVALGEGTEKISLFLQERYPNHTIIKMDRDSCKTHTELQSLLNAIHQPGPKLIVATQMLVKGHHIPALNSVIVLGADQALYSQDFRAHEYLLAQMHQVIGRSGREGETGHVLIQSDNTQHPIWSSLMSTRYYDAALELLAERERYQLPPFQYQTTLTLSAKHQTRLNNYALKIREHLDNYTSNLSIVGPIEPSQSMINGEHRRALVIQSQRPSDMQAALIALAALSHPTSIRAIIDRDPID